MHGPTTFIVSVTEHLTKAAQGMRDYLVYCSRVESIMVGKARWQKGGAPAGTSRQSGIREPGAVLSSWSPLPIEWELGICCLSLLEVTQEVRMPFPTFSKTPCPPAGWLPNSVTKGKGNGKGIRVLKVPCL